MSIGGDFMSIEREFRRRAMRADMRANGMRSTCRQCGNRMCCKPGYGWVCPSCGWEPSAQAKARAEIEEDEHAR